MRTAIVLAAVLVADVHLSWAQGTDPAQLTLGEAIARALTTSQRLAEALAREEGATAAVTSEARGDRPNVVLSAGYTRMNHVDEFGLVQPNGTFTLVYPDLPNNYLSRATFQWPIYTAGRTDALVRAAEAEARAVGADVEVTRADLRLEVQRTYWALVTATESVDVMQEAVARADAHVRDIRSRFDAGLVPPNEVSAAEAQRSRQQLLLIEARNVRGSTLEELRRLTGIVTDIVPTEVLASDRDPLATPPAGAGAPPLRAEQRALSERIAASEERLKAIEATRAPTVAFHATGDFANPNTRHFPRADEWRTSWEVGVVASWTLWDGGRTSAQVAEANAARRALRARQAEVTSLIATEVRQRQLDVDSAHAALQASESALVSAAETRRVVDERFAVGVATSTEVLDAQLALTQAELDRTRALANIRLAEARLDRARGVP